MLLIQWLLYLLRRSTLFIENSSEVVIDSLRVAGGREAPVELLKIRYLVFYKQVALTELEFMALLNSLVIENSSEAVIDSLRIACGREAPAELGERLYKFCFLQPGSSYRAYLNGITSLTSFV